MTRSLLKPAVLVFVALGAACIGDEVLEPLAPGQATARNPVVVPLFTRLLLTPSYASLEQGDAVQLESVPFDQWDKRMPLSAITAVKYASADNRIASVTASGLVTGISPGPAEISATVTLGNVTKAARMRIDVLKPAISDAVALTSGTAGWQPASVHVPAGTTVQWRAGPIGWSGMPNDTIWLLSPDYSVVDKIPLEDGIATRRFDKAGLVRYCSGGCWDPPDFGAIYVE